MPALRKGESLTTKQKLFVREYVKQNGNGQKAALRVYDAKNGNVARNIASENLAKPNVKEELDRVLQKGELQLNKITDRLSDIIISEPAKGFSGADVLEAVKTGLKLHGVLTERKVTTTYNLNADLAKLSKYELIERHKKLKQETEVIIEGEEG